MIRKILIVGGLLFFIGCGNNNANVIQKIDNKNFEKILKEAKKLNEIELQWNVDASNVNKHFSNIQEGRTVLHQVVIASKNNSNKAIELVKFLLMRGANFNIRDNYGRTPLFYAINNLNRNDMIYNMNIKKIIYYLLKYGANPYMGDKNGITPFKLALKKGDYELVIKIISKTGNIEVLNRLDDNIKKIILYKILSRNINVDFSFLLNKNNINEVLKNGMPPLLIAVKANRDKNLIEYLIKNGANLNVKDNKGYPPLYYAIYYGNLDNVEVLLQTSFNENPKKFLDEIIPFLIKYNKVHYLGFLKDKNGNTLLHKAVQIDNLDVANILLGKISKKVDLKGKKLVVLYSTGININKKNKNLQTPLEMAIKYKRNNFIKLFLMYPKVKLDINLLDLALKNSNIKAFDMLIKYIDINSITKNGNPLILEVNKQHIIKKLLQNGAFINAKSVGSGDTILHKMIKNKNYKMAKYLIYNGADLYIKNKKGITPFDLIENKKLKNEIQIYYINYLANNGNFEKLKLLTETNPNLVYLISDKKLRLALTGPKGLKVGDIRQMIKKGRSNKLIISLIKRVNEPYKQFSLDEIDTLVEMGLNDDVISAMIDVTTEIFKDKKRKAEQEYYLQQQKKLLTQKPIIKERVKVIYRDSPTKTTNPVLDKIQDKLIEKATDKLIDSLF